MSVQDYDFDAFISYRHVMPDMAVATKLLRLLYGYRAPRKCQCVYNNAIRRIFRDTEELPIGSDLNDEIHTYLRRSRFLIVICTEKILESSYCMDEIDYFKKQHGNSIENVLVVLADPMEDVLSPAEKERINALLSKVLGIPMIEKPIPMTDHITSTLEIEPHYADARALTIRKQKKLLQNEYLRIAAVLLGCEYDDLNRWHFHRRAARMAALSACTIAASLAVAYVIASFAYRTWQAEIETRNMNASLYYQKSVNSMTAEDDVQSALFEATQAVALSAANVTDARVRAALLFQSGVWGYVSDSRTGVIVDGYVLAYGTDEEAGIVAVESGIDLSRVCAVGNAGRSLLLDGENGFSVTSPDSKVLDRIDPAYSALRASDGEACWILEDTASRAQDDSSGSFLAYDPQAGTGSVVLYPTSAQWGIFSVSNGGTLVTLLSGDRVYLYDKADDTYILRDAEGLKLDGLSDMIVGATLSPDGNILVVRSYMQLEAIATRTWKTLFPQDLSEISQFDSITCVAFSPDSRSIAVAYGADPTQPALNAKGYVQIYSYKGEVLFSTAGASNAPVVGCTFNTDGTLLAVRDNDGMARVYACVDGEWAEACIPIYIGKGASKIGFVGSDGVLAADGADSAVRLYRYASLGDRVAFNDSANGFGEIEYVVTDGAGLVLVTSEGIVRLDGDGRVAGEIKRSAAEYDELIADIIEIGQIQNVSSAISPSLYRTEADTWPAGNGMSFRLDGQTVEVLDESAAVVASTEYTYRMNRPLVACDAASGTLVLAVGEMQDELVSATRLYTFRYDEGTQKIIHAEFESEVGFYPDSIWMFGDQGVAALASTYGELMLLDLQGSAAGVRYLRTGTYDTINQVVMGEDGLLALVAEYYDSADTRQYEKVELWNAKTGALLFENDGRHIYAGGVRLSDGALYYSSGFTLYRMEITTLDGAAWESVMLGVSGYAQGEDGDMVRTVSQSLTEQLDQANGIVTADQPNIASKGD